MTKPHPSPDCRTNRLALTILTLRGSRREILAVTIIVLLALVLRTWDLSDLPAGFHGDEAVVGLEAQRILDQGYIGPYSPFAAGQPTGPIYLVALSIALLDNTVLAVRIVPALLGTLTVLALYVVARRSLGVPVALVAASTLAVMSWHLHFSRIGFPLVAWPLLTVLIVGSLVEAMRSGSWRWWTTAGALTGAGIYVYNAHFLLAAVIGLFLAGYLVLNRRRPVKQDLAGAALFSLAALIVALPMANFALSEDSYYWDHFERDRITETQEWQELDGPVEQARFLATGYQDIWKWLYAEPELDLVDGTGTTIVTPPSMLLLAAFGMVIGLGFYRRPLVVIAVLVVLIMPLGPVLSVGGETRRTLVTAPFLSLCVGLATAGTVDLARRESRRLAQATAVASVLILGVVAVQNLDLYFRDFAAPEIQAQILGTPMADAAKYMDTLDPDEYYVYFYSDIWSIDYATRLYLAPDVRGANRSHRFGEYSHDVVPSRGTPLFIFLGDYLDDLEIVKERYPGREVTPNDFELRPTFRAYEVELQ